LLNNSFTKNNYSNELTALVFSLRLGANEAANVFIVICTTNNLISFGIGFMTHCILKRVIVLYIDSNILEHRYKV